MGFWNWLWRTRETPAATEPVSEREIDVAIPLLREFIYLDEVSLRSLLASQQGAVTDSITNLEGRADQAELAAAVGASFGVASAKVDSRFQTARNEEQQVSRKAIVQSLFKEFRELEEIDSFLIRVNTGSNDVIDLQQLSRGTLIEVEVELLADPVFRFSSVMDELQDIAADFPEMLAAPGSAEVLTQMGPLNKILQRLMVGLVPIRAKAVEVSVARSGQLVQDHADPTSDALPLEIVGVTDERNYWQDVRRLLFSGSRFTMLCRVAHDGIRAHWSPVKAADVIAELLPAFPEMLESVGDIEYAAPVDRISEANSSRLRTAVTVAVGLAFEKLGSAEAPIKDAQIDAILRDFPNAAANATDQRSALDAAIDTAEAAAGTSLDETVRKSIRKDSRVQSGLRILGPQRPIDSLTPTTTSQAPREAKALLETEIIAIYW